MSTAPDPGWIRLDDAASRLGTTPRELSERLQAAGRAMRRQQIDGRWYSFAHVSDLGLETDAPAPRPSADLDTGHSLVERLRTLREQRDAFESALNQARHELAERDGLRDAQWRELEIELEDARSRRSDAEQSAQDWMRRFDEASQRIQILETRLAEAQREQGGHFDALREAREEKLRLEHDLDLRSAALRDEQERRRRFENELNVAREVELSRERYCDRLERELQRRKGA